MVSKVVGVIFSVTAGFAVGKEGKFRFSIIQLSEGNLVTNTYYTYRNPTQFATEMISFRTSKILFLSILDRSNDS